jgi:glycosyltransferase involved in cell wall biosynthesis
MKIGIAGDITLSMLQDLFPPGTSMPHTLSVPLIASIARGLHQRGHEIAVFALSREVNETQFYKGTGVEAYVCPQRRPRLQMADFFRAECRALTDAVRESGCDVIHAHWTYEFGTAAIRSRMPHVITAHDTPVAVIRYARHPYGLERALLGFPVIRNARHITAVSPYVTASLRRIRGSDDVTTIVNGVGPEVFAMNSLRKQPTRGEVVFASVLNYWHGRKNGRRLIQAFALVRARLGISVQLRLYGIDFAPDGPAAVWARAHGVDSGIQFCGPAAYKEMLAAIATEADILVHPSLEEAHCMAVTEAMAIGVPVIGGKRSGGIPWALAHGKAGLLVDVRSPSAIAQGMQKMAEDYPLRESFGAEGRALALRDYQMEPIVDRYLDCLAAAAQGG